MRFNERLRRLLGDNIKMNQIYQSTGMSRLLNNPPPNKNGDGVVDIATIQELIVVEDPVEWYPSFDQVLYCSLDVDMLILYVMYFMVFEITVKSNSLLSLFFVYLIERIFRKLRIDHGVDNMCEKTYVDDNFLSWRRQ